MFLLRRQIYHTFNNPDQRRDNQRAYHHKPVALRPLPPEKQQFKSKAVRLEPESNRAHAPHQRTRKPPRRHTQTTTPTHRRRHVYWPRTLLTAFTLITALIVLYASCFYLPAFTHSPKVLSISTHHVKTPEVNQGSHLFMPYINHFKQRRVYLRPGQTLLLRYNLPESTKLHTVIRKCHKPVIFEALYCGRNEPIVFSDELLHSGEMKFEAGRTGFYIYDDILAEGNQTSPKPYIAVWERR